MALFRKVMMITYDEDIDVRIHDNICISNSIIQTFMDEIFSINVL